VCYRRFGGESSIEGITRQLLESSGLGFVAEFNVGGRDVFDFYVPARNLLIECDGTYWHSLPGVEKRDALKTARAQKAGYAVVRFGEDLIQSPSFSDHLSRALAAAVSRTQMALFALTTGSDVNPKTSA